MKIPGKTANSTLKGRMRKTSGTKFRYTLFTMTDRDIAHRRYLNAAVALATAVSTDDRIRTDPAFPADRSPRAERLRASMLAQALAEYRDAEAVNRAAWAA